MNLNVKKIRIVGEVGKNDTIIVTGSVPDAKMEDITLDFEVPSKTGHNYVREHLGNKYNKWQFIMEV